jgi:hypothetical protein
MPPEFDWSYAICQLLPVADLFKCLLRRARHLMAGTIGTTGTLERLEPALGLNGLNEAKRLNGWNGNGWNWLFAGVKVVSTDSQGFAT